jgi:hypothetical protein
MPDQKPNPRAAGQAAKQRRLDAADRRRQRFPWLMPLIVGVAIAIVVAAIVVAIALGKFF